ncbi:MAG: FIST signal transduction protein [Planctomycetaceae bacterium]
MFLMAVGHSDEIEPTEAIAAVVTQCEEGLAGRHPNAGLLFANYDTDPVPLVSGVRDAFPGIELIGSTSVGEMSSVLGFREDSVTLAVFASDTVDVTAGWATDAGSDPEGAARRAALDARSKTEKEPRLCLAFPSVSREEPSRLLRELRAQLGDGVHVLGGGSGPRVTGETSPARQFHADQIDADAVALLLFSGPLAYSFGVDTGWRPVGREGTVTEASGMTVRTIDDEPAVAFYERYLGPGAKPSAANPLAVFDGDPEGFYLRVPLRFEAETGAIEVAGDVAPGSTVRLTVAVTDDIFDGTRSAATEALRSYPGGAEPRAALVFSCAVRKMVLGTRTGMELDIARERFGPSVPICGLYCFGEIAPVRDGSTRFHNETIVAVLLGDA